MRDGQRALRFASILRVLSGWDAGDKIHDCFVVMIVCCMIWSRVSPSILRRRYKYDWRFSMSIVNKAVGRAKSSPL